MKKNFAKAIAVILLGAIIILVLSRVLLLKSEDGISQLQSYYKQDKNTIDALFLGSSHVYCDISTGILWDEYGIAGYDLGGAEAPSFTSYYHLKEALKTQRPKVIFYEISIAALRPTLYPPEFWVEDNNYGMKWGKERVEMLKANTLEQTFPKLLFPLSAMHGRYKDLTENDFTNINSSINYKGFDPREYVTEFETPDIKNVTESVPCSEKAEEYLRKIIAYTKEENIPLVFFVSPYVVSEEEQKMYNYMFAIGEAEGVDIIDFNKLYDEMGMDFSTDMAEELHLNYSGNYKFSSYLGKILTERYSIPDRRGEKGYESWEIDALRQRSERTDLDLTNTKKPEKFIKLASKDGYANFVHFGEDVSEISEEVKESLGKLGVSEENIEPNTNYLIENGEILYKENTGFRIARQYGNDFLLFLEEGEGDNYSFSLYVNGKQYEKYDGSAIFTYNTVLNKYIGNRDF